jgi:hypothetical protein
MGPGLVHIYGFNTNNGTGAGLYRWKSKRGTASVLGSMAQYSRLKYMPLMLYNGECREGLQK